MFWNSGFDAPSTGFLVQLELEYSLITLFLDLGQLFPGATGAFSCSTRLRISDFWSWSGSPTVSRAYFHFFSLIGIHRIDQIRQTLRRVFLTPQAAHHQINWSRLRGNWWSRLCHRRAFIWSRLLTSFWHGALYSNLIVRKKSHKWPQENITKLIMLNKQRRLHHSWREKLSLVRMSASWF